jgi:hypothetical protein
MPSVLPRRVRACAVVIALLPLLPVLGCGGGGSNFGGSATGGFSVASFNGHYAIALTGANSEGVLRESGVLTPDGKGNITSGTMDVAQGGGVTSLIFDGTYKLNADGTGVATLNLPGGNIKLAMTLVSRSTVYAIENDHFANVSGILEQQDPAAFAAVPVGTFVFSLHGLQGPGSSAIVGTFKANKGTLAGDQDANLSGTLKTQAPLAGSFTAPDTTGRGTMRLSNAAGGTSSFFYYVVNTDTFRILSSDTSGLSGRAERQAAGPFGDASLAGGYAFGSTGDTTVVGASRAAGRFNADGAGTVSAGQSDAVVNGTMTTATGFSGSYAIDSAGRGTMNTVAVGAGSSRILRLVSARRALFLVAGSAAVEDGSMERQQGSFSNAALNGQYALVLGGSGPNGLVNRLGVLQANGQGSATFSGILNLAGKVSQPPSLSGSYALSAGGRCVANVGNLSPNLLLYLVSSTQAYALQAEDQTEVSGMLARQ